MMRCAVLGHRFRFTADGPVMTWSCERGCGVGGQKHYPSPRQAAHYAAALDADDPAEAGSRPTLVSLLPLRAVAAARRVFRR